MRTARLWSSLTARIVVAVAVLGFTGIAVLATCINPPINDSGLGSSRVYYFAFVGSDWSDTFRSCATSAFNDWTGYDTDNLGVQFQPLPPNTAANVTVTWQNLGGTTAGGANKSYDEHGYISGGGIQIAKDGGKVTTCDAVRKVVAHELGHLHGLDDASGSGGSSIMNQLAGLNDAGGNLPLSPTGCDAATSENAYYNTEVICHYYPPCEEGMYVDQYGCCVSPYSPLLIDFDGSRTGLTGPSVMFDLGGTGESLFVGWPAANSQLGWLSLDRNLDGAITSGTELFGSVTEQPCSPRRNGFAALAQYDEIYNGGNRDGRITAEDAIFQKLLVWFDRNADGVSDSSELQRLAVTGVTALDLTYKESRRTDGYGNVFQYRAKVSFVDGHERYYWDVFLAH
jgi:hypothetical protein